MHSRALISLSLTCVFMGTSAAADDPFVGKWKFNSQQSKVTGMQEVIEDLGGNKYKFSFGDDSWTILADGSDQPVKYGGTMSWKQTGPNSWISVRKQGGKVSSRATWTLSDDGDILTQTSKGTRPDGSSFTADFKGKRVAGTKGIAGTWESTEFKADSYSDWEIEPYDGDGLSFKTPSDKESQDMKFDGKYYPDNGPNVAPGSTSAAKRVNARTIEWTDKLKEEVVDRMVMKVSEDGKTLTLLIRYPGEKKSQTVVYSRQ